MASDLGLLCLPIYSFYGFSGKNVLRLLYQEKCGIAKCPACFISQSSIFKIRRSEKNITFVVLNSQGEW